MHRGRTAVSWKRKFCSSVSLHRRIAFVCVFHRANHQSCGSSEALPLCKAMWAPARLRWRDQGHLVGCASCLLACFLCCVHLPSVRGHVRFINSSISMVCSREPAFPGTGKPLVRTCMILFQVTKWLDKRVPLSRRDAASQS